MSPVAIVTIVLATLVALAVVAFFIAIALVLRKVNARLGALVRDVVAIIDKTEPVGPAVMSIDRDLATARNVLESLLEGKLKAKRIRSPETPASLPTRIRDRRGASASWFEDDPADMDWRRGASS